MRSAERPPSGRLRRDHVAGAVLGLGVVGAVIGVLLAVHVRYTCGSQIQRLIELVCDHATHPYRTLGLVLAAVCALLGAAAAVALIVLRQGQSGRD